MSINELIQQITPLYNKYRESKNKITGTESLEIMWDIGDILKNYIGQNKIAPHNLFWSVYGNAEGTKHIAKKSYITREFQNRCHRIRRIFYGKEQIKKDFPNLKNFTTFREAMPFFDEGKYKLKGKDRENLLGLLNSELQPKKILEKIKVLQKEKIGIKNPRTQRLHEVEKEKQIFIKFYNYLYNIIKLNDYKLCLDKVGSVDLNYIRVLSKNISTLTQEGLKVFDFDILDNLKTPWREFSKMVSFLITQKNPTVRRRFRRLIPVERIVKLADMLYSLSSEENYKGFTKKLQ